jgi:hypothetical protein
MEDEVIGVKVAVVGTFQYKINELVPVNPISNGIAPLIEAFKVTAEVFAATVCPDIVIETELAFETEVEKKYDPVELMERKPDHGLDVMMKG